MNRETFFYRGAEKREACGEIFFSGEGKSLPAIIICHGFKSFKDWGFFPYLATRLAAAGFYVVTFNFSHNGCDRFGNEEADLEAFKNNRFAFERKDLETIHHLLRDGKLPFSECANKNDIHILGHSRGGASALESVSFTGVRSIALLASISRYPGIDSEELMEWQKNGVHWIENQRTKTRLPLGLGLLEELRCGSNRLLELASQTEIPVCIIHGTNDQTVKVESARELALTARNSELHLLEGVGHTFEVRHPFLESSPALDETIAILQTFFRARSSLAPN